MVIRSKRISYWLVTFSHVGSTTTIHLSRFELVSEE